MILPDHEIRRAIAYGEIGYTPFDPALVQPASIDMRLDSYFRVYDSYKGPVDPANPERRTGAPIVGDEFVLSPQHFALASTIERVTFPNDIVGRLEGKSSLARMGLFIHVTAGFFDPGFDGYATLEIFNANPNPVILRTGMRICQMSFMRLSSPAESPYGSSHLGSKYQHQERGPQESAYYKNFKDGKPL